jgi:phage-related minor tail protein
MAGSIKGITIEIDGETTGLQKALSGVNKQTRDLQSELKQVDKLLKLDPKNTELLAQKQQILKEQVQATADKLKSLRDAQAQVNEQYKKGEISEEQYRAFQRELAKTEQQLKSYKGELKEVESQTNKLEQATKKTGDVLKNIGGKMSDVGKGMTKGITAPIAAVGAASMAAWKEVDEGLDTIIVKTGATGKAAEELTGSFRNVAKQVPTDMQSVGDAIGEVNTQFGLTGKALEDAATQLIKFSTLNGTDVTTATQSAKAAIDAFGMSAQDLSKVLDTANAVGQQTGISMDSLFAALQRGAPQIKAMGLDFSTAAMMIGQMEQKGIDSSKAMSYLSKAQVQWAKDGKTMEQGLAELEKKLSSSKSETDKLALASELFGTKGAPFMLDAINRGALDFDTFSKAAQGAGDSVSKTFEGTLDPADKLTLAMNNLKLAGADLASAMQEALAPILDKLVVKLQEFSDWFSKLSPQQQDMILKIGALAAALGPAVIVTGKFVSAIGDITKGIAPLAGKLPGATTAVGNFLGKFATGSLDAIKGFGSAIVDVATSAGSFATKLGTDAFNAVTSFGSAIGDGVAKLGEFVGKLAVDGLQAAGNFASKIGEGALKIGEFATKLAVDGVKAVASFAVQLATTAWSAITSFVGAMGGAIASAWSFTAALLANPITWIVAAILGLIAVIILLWKNWDDVSKFLTETWTKIKEVGENVWNGLKDFFAGVWEAITTKINEVWNGIKEFLSGLWEGIKTKAGEIWEGVKTAIMTPINSISGLLSGVWSSITTTASNAWNGLKKSASDIFGKVKDAILAPFKNLHIPLPHFKFSTKQVSVAGLKFPIPDIDIDWYKTGAIFTQPSVIGVGEAGPEAVVPIDKLGSILADTLKQMNTQTAAGPTVIVQNMTVRNDDDIYRISRELNGLIQSSNRARGMR